MIASTAPPPPRFPPPEDIAQAFYREGVRHLSDAHCLHHNSAWAGAITSAMKASELGAKALLIQQNAMGIYDRIFNTHKPYTEMESHPILKSLAQELGIRLSLDVREMEALEPNLFGKRNFEASEANTEYPFLLNTTDNRGKPTGIVTIKSPAQFFDVAASERYCRIAYDLLDKLSELHPTISTWKITLPQRV